MEYRIRISKYTVQNAQGGKTRLKTAIEPNYMTYLPNNEQQKKCVKEWKHNQHSEKLL